MQAVFRSDSALFRAIAARIAEDQGMEIDLDVEWPPHLDANGNLERFVRRQILKPEDPWALWTLDDADRLFDHVVDSSEADKAAKSLGTQVFTMFRSWRNSRDSDPDSRYRRLTLLIACSTDNYLHLNVAI